ncbi:hypothetical protein ABT120_20010 [Nonomuraea angiospora]|uniref:hypothetical protein n=1 Tax=Nonomuraea angiospora TaxID=46172 RepID=UPI003329821F
MTTPDPDPLLRSVIRHSIESSPALEIQLGIGPMLDVPAHKVLQDDLRAEASPWEVHVAVASLRDILPDQPGLYMFVWRPSIRLAMADNSQASFHQVLYIGQAGGSGQRGNTIRNRFRDYCKHLRGDPEALWTQEAPTTRTARLTHYLALRPLEFWFATVEDRSKIKNLESRLINLYNPPLNNQNRPRLRARVSATPRPTLRP